MKRHQILIVILFSILIGFAHPLLAAVYSTTEETHISVAITANAEDYTVQSEKQDEIKDYEQAIENYTEAIRLNPNDIDAFFNRSNAYTKLQNYQEAIDDLTEVIRLNPDNTEAYIGRGLSHSRLENYPDAIKDLTQAIRLSPDRAEVYVMRGLVYSLAQHYQMATEDFNQALKIKPNFAEAQRSLSRVKSMQNRLEASNFVTQGNKNYNRGDYEGAIEDYTTAIRLNSDNAPIYSLRGYARIKLKDYTGAIEDFTQYLQIKPNDAATKRILEELKAKNRLNDYSASQRLQITLFVSVLLCFVWIISISLHEFGHAIVAYWGGDQSVKTKGYLTLNPLKYTHPITSIIFPAIFFMFGGFPLPGAAVYIRQQQLRNRWWQSAVAAAGPLASFLFILFLIALFQISSVSSAPYWLSATLAFFISLHVLFMLFNLIPFPPLDGYGILEVWLPQTLQSSLRKFALLGLIAIGVMSFFSPFTQLIVRSAFTLTQLFGVPEAMSLAGLELFNRWYCALLLMAIGAFFLIRRPQSLYFFLGEIAASCRKLDWAFAIYDRAVQLAPRDAWAWARRGWLLLALIQSPGLLSRKRLEDSLQSFSHAIQIKPDYYFPWAGRGWALYLSGRYAEAIVAYEQAIDLEQDDYLVWNERGVVLVSLNRYNEALDSFNRAIALRPDLNWLRQRRDLLQGKVILNS